MQQRCNRPRRRIRSRVLLSVGHDGAMRVVLDGSNDRQLVLSHRYGTSEDLRYMAELVLPQGRAAVGVWEYNSGLAAFVRELADGWRGFDEVKVYGTTEGHLELSCRHDGLGTV